MNKFLTALLIGLAISPSAFAQIEGAVPEEISPAQAQRIINEDFLTEEVVKTTAPLKKHIDYIAKNYEERPLRELIKNAEEIERKVAKKLEEDYVPYDRRIDVKNPEQVKRFFRKRISVIY
ncbi:MAG: hypothetical protein J6K16_05620 [Alphaproteobacteria bacterium]|nr:hypothetical protein [Alphaproteobacteria bacterium]